MANWFRPKKMQKKITKKFTKQIKNTIKRYHWNLLFYVALPWSCHVPEAGRASACFYSFLHYETWNLSLDDESLCLSFFFLLFLSALYIFAQMTNQSCNFGTLVFCSANVGDVEEGNRMNNSHSGGNRESVRNNVEKEEPKEPKEEKSSHSKEKSVLQAKLTKLAIQIGYAGKPFGYSIYV